MSLNPFVSKVSGNDWVAPVSAMSLVLGVVLSLAWITKTNRDSRLGQLPGNQVDRIERGSLDEIDRLQKEALDLNNEVAKLRREKTQLENSIGTNSQQAKILNQTLQELKLFAGLSDVKGPGIQITLRDSAKEAAGGPTPDQNIHDIDVLKVVNELWASGSEAISVNGHRVVSSTSFRCVGPTILVDGQRIATPVIIRAIGDTETLFGGMNLKGGALDEIRSFGDPEMVQVEKVKGMVLRAYTGPTARDYVKVQPQKP